MLKYLLMKNKLTGIKSIRITATGEIILESDSRYPDFRKKATANYRRWLKDKLMEDAGLTKVKGSVSGKTYYE